MRVAKAPGWLGHKPARPLSDTGPEAWIPQTHDQSVRPIWTVLLESASRCCASLRVLRRPRSVRPSA
ncbi:protein of unknown function [Methylorubrum extorquens]|uniref:Uncharacterized protein n=1 Tax=Methylorubrum extorquens TaxID=408 RepID=A0A2N9AMZ4_METEX|nr:protein of unknown function [Methylorubrum extorquens]